MPSSDIYLYNRPQASGNRGIACIAFALVDGRGNAVGNLSWPRPASSSNLNNSVDGHDHHKLSDPPVLEDLDHFIKTIRYVKDVNSKRPGNPVTSHLNPSQDLLTVFIQTGPVALLEFRIWERGHINRDTLNNKLEAALGHALWDVVLEYHLLPFPLCVAPEALGAEDSTIGSQSLPCSEPTTPVRSQSFRGSMAEARGDGFAGDSAAGDEDMMTDPRSRSVSFSGLPPHRAINCSADSAQPSSGTSGFCSPFSFQVHGTFGIDVEPKWKMRHMSGTHIRSERPLSPLSIVQVSRRLTSLSCHFLVRSSSGSC